LSDSAGGYLFASYTAPDHINIEQINNVHFTATSTTDNNWTDEADVILIVYIPEFTSVSISPDTVELNINESYQFFVNILDQMNREIETGEDTIWSAEGGVIDTTGLYTAGNIPGTYEITAELGQITGKGYAVIVDTTTSVKEIEIFKLSGNNKMCSVYPNPFSNITTICFRVDKHSKAKLTIFNQIGQETATLVDELFNAGNYEVIWNGNSAENGIYYYKLQIGEQIESGLLVLVK